MNAEKLLGIAADSQKSGTWNDSLSYMIDSVKSKHSMTALSDDELSMVAGGTDSDKEAILRLKRAIWKE